MGLQTELDGLRHKSGHSAGTGWISGFNDPLFYLPYCQDYNAHRILSRTIDFWENWRILGAPYSTENTVLSQGSRQTSGCWGRVCDRINVSSEQQFWWKVGFCPVGRSSPLAASRRRRRPRLTLTGSEEEGCTFCRLLRADTQLVHLYRSLPLLTRGGGRPREAVSSVNVHISLQNLSVKTSNQRRF